MLSSLVSEGRRRKKQFVPVSDPCAMLPSMKRQLFRNIIVLLIRTQIRICPTPAHLLNQSPGPGLLMMYQLQGKEKKQHPHSLILAHQTCVIINACKFQCMHVQIKKYIFHQRFHIFITNRASENWIKRNVEKLYAVGKTEYMENILSRCLREI